MTKYYSSLYKLNDSNNKNDIILHNIEENSKLYNDFKHRIKSFEFEEYDWSTILNNDIIYVSDTIKFIDGDDYNIDISNMLFGHNLVDKNHELYECYTFLKDIFEFYDSLEEFKNSEKYIKFSSNYKDILLKHDWIENYENNNVCKYDENKNLIGYKTNYTLYHISEFIKNNIYIFIKDVDVPRITKTKKCLTGDEYCFIKNCLKFPEAMDYIELNEDNSIIYEKSEFIKFLERFAFDINDFSEMIENFIDYETIYTVS